MLASGTCAKPRSSGGRFRFSRPSSPPVTECHLIAMNQRDLAERDRQQRVVDAAAVRDERRDERARERRGQHAAREIDPQIQRDVLLHQPEPVRADAEERAVPERRQAGVAEQQVVALRIQHPDRDLDGEVRIQADARQPPRRRDHDRDQRDERRRERGAMRRAGAAAGARAGGAELWRSRLVMRATACRGSAGSACG